MRATNSISALVLSLLVLGSVARDHSDDLITVALVLHTHDDLGWCRTVSGYYDHDVRDILDQVLTGLVQGPPERLFDYVEVGFLQIWWDRLSSRRRDMVRDLVKSGRLSLLNGAWSMNDQATCHHSDIADDLALGALWLQATFGINRSTVPKVGWMVDPFGQTSGMAWLYWKAGYHAVVFGRAPPGTQEQFQFVWRPEGGYSDQAEMFGYFHDGYCEEPPAAEERDLPTVKEWAFSRHMLSEKTKARTVLADFGCDFTRPNFEGTDKLRGLLSRHPEFRLRAEYMSVESFVASLHRDFESSGRKLPVFSKDFLPYWTGFFSSRHQFKQLARRSSGFFHAATALHALAPCGEREREEGAKQLNVMWMALGLIQHHDAITGTSEPFVYDDDYNDRLNTGIDSVRSALATSIGAVVGVPGSAVDVCDPGLLATCHHVSPVEPGQELSVVVYNPLSVASTDRVHLELPLPLDGLSLSVSSASGLRVPHHQIVVPRGRGGRVSQLSWLAGDVPALGIKMFRITVEKGSSSGGKSTGGQQSGYATRFVAAENRVLKIFYDLQKSQVVSVENKVGHVSSPVDVQLMWYESAADGNDGAYDFRSRGNDAYDFKVLDSSSLTSSQPQVVDGDLFTDFNTYYENGAVVTVRLGRGRGFKENILEVITAIGGIDVSDGRGRNVILRVSTNIESQGKFFGDSNGLTMIERERGGRWPVGHVPPGVDPSNPGVNYYPMTVMASIRDNTTQMVILSDKAEGCGSQIDGTLEVMVYRRLLHGDGKGMDTPLREPQPITTTHWLMFDSVSRTTQLMGQASLAIYNPPVLAVLAPGAQPSRREWNPLKQEAVGRAHVQTLQVLVPDWSGKPCRGTKCQIPFPEDAAPLPSPHPSSLPSGSVILRLANLQDTPTEVTIGDLFADWTVSTAEEYTLNVAQPREKTERLKWTSEAKSPAQAPWRPGKGTAKLGPMDIRTFVLSMTPKH